MKIISGQLRKSKNEFPRPKTSLILALCCLQYSFLLTTCSSETNSEETSGDREKIEDFDSEGNLKRSFFVEDGVKIGLYTSFYSNGNKQTECTYENGVIDGDFIDYYENGNLKSVTPFRNGIQEGIVTTFYSSGQISTKFGISSDRPHGNVQFFHENGKLEHEGENYYGNRVGEWKYYDSTGKLIRIEHFEGNVLMSTELIDSLP